MNRLEIARSRSVFILALLVTSLHVQSAAAQKTLRWNLHPGETIQVQLSQRMNSAADLQGTVLESSIDMHMAMKWHVFHVEPDGTAEMSQSIERVKMSMQSPGAEVVTYDSTAGQELVGAARNIASGIRPLLGVDFIQRMNSRGEILDVRLSKEAAEALDRIPSGAQLKQMFSEHGLKTLINQAAAVLPEKPVHPGDRWHGQAETKSPTGDLTMDIQYVYQGTVRQRDRDLEKIAVHITVTLPEASNPLGLSVNVKEQDNTGVLYFDAAVGRFVETQLRQRMTLETVLGQRRHQQKIDTQLDMQFVSKGLSVKDASQPRTARATKAIGVRGQN